MGNTLCNDIIFGSFAPITNPIINISNKSFYKSAGLQAYSSNTKSLNVNYLGKINISNMESDTPHFTDDQIQAYWT